MDKRYFSDKIVKWYLNNKRNLPWRETKEPYKIWLSEIILQQTRVNQGLPYYEGFIKKYPTVNHLADAPEQEVLRLWQGLGYYTRARNLHKCARIIKQQHKSEFPASYDSLLTLPGIGEYTAAAISSIAFNQPVAVVDGNVFRLLSRIFGIDTPINSPEGKKVFASLANDLITSKHPDLHNQAVMEFGALLCTPKNPHCGECIFQKDCLAYKGNLQHELPVKLKLRPGRKRYFYYIVMEHESDLLMRKRVEKDIWLGLFDFHLIEKNRTTSAENILSEEPLINWIPKPANITVSKSYKHTLTHQTIYSRFIMVKSRKRVIPHLKDHSFYSLRQIAELPKPVLVSRFLSDHYLL